MEKPKFKFLIYVGQVFGFPIARPLQAEIKKRGFEVAWFNEIPSNNQYIKKGERFLKTVESVMEYCPDVVLVATDLVPSFFPGIKVQIFHGFPANKRKGTDQFIIRGFYDLYCTQGPTSTLVFKEKSCKLKHFEVVETGWSKMDPLFPLIKRVPNKKPVILVSSTFTKKYSLAFNPEVVRELKNLSKIGKWHFDVVLHPLISKEVKEEFKAMQNENFVYHDTTDLIPLFKKSDVMLCDTSSALIEYQLQNKPVVTFRNNMPLPSYYNITDVSEIEQAITTTLTRPGNLMKEIEKYTNESHPYFDGKSSERVIDACVDFLENKKVKRKPLNLIRKYKMRKKLNYFKFFNKKCMK